MAAVAEFLEQPVIVAEAGEAPLSDPAIDPRAWQQAIEQSNLALAREVEIPESVKLLVEELADQVAALPQDATLRVDPYLLLAAQRALIGSLRALDFDDPAEARRQMRVRLEQLRQVYRDLAEGGPLYEDRSAKEIARWLESVVDVSQARIAELLGVSARTFQRWISSTDPVGPEGDDSRRVRIVAAVINHLRHAVTGPGAVAWFERAHPRLGGARPIDLLSETDAPTRLVALAASARSSTAA